MVRCVVRLRKAKYIKRWRGKDGKWNYEYARPGAPAKGKRDKGAVPKARKEGRPKSADSWDDLAKRRIIGKQTAEKLTQLSQRDNWGVRFERKLMKAIQGAPKGMRAWMEGRAARDELLIVYRKNLEGVPDCLRSQYEMAAAVTVNGMRIEFIKGKPIDTRTLVHELVHLGWNDIRTPEKAEALDELLTEVIADGAKVLKESRKYRGKERPEEVDFWVWRHSKVMQKEERAYQKTLKERGKDALERSMTFGLELNLMIPGGRKEIFESVLGRKVDAQYQEIAYYAALAKRFGVELQSSYALEEAIAYKAGSDPEFADKVFRLAAKGNLGKAIWMEENMMNLIIPLRKAKGNGAPREKDFENEFDYWKAFREWQLKEGKGGVASQKSIVLMPTEMLKGKGCGLSKPQGAGNAPGTIPPRDPEGGGKGEQPRGAPKAEPSKRGGSPNRLTGRKANIPPYLEMDIKVSGSESSAADNYLKLVAVDTGKAYFLKLGTKHKAKFNHSGNIIKITIDGKRYPIQNHLVKVPSGVFKIAGMVTVANKVVGAGA